MLTAQLSNQESFHPPFAKSFAGHQTFAFRYFWLKKGLDLVCGDSEAFQRDDAVVRLGVGKNMVQSIRHWCLATRVVEEEPRTRSRSLWPTDFGSRLLSDNGWDPYLEDDATLWLIHWNLANIGSRAATWYWAFNRFHEYSFTRTIMVELLIGDMQALGWSDISHSTIRRDVDCFVHTYLSPRADKAHIDDAIECPLSNLGILIQEPDSERLRFKTGPKTTLPAAVFAYALAQFWDKRNNGGKALELREIMRSEGSPGLIFKLDQESMLGYLDALKDVTSGYMVFEDTSLVRRVIRPRESACNPMSFLEDYYGSR